MAKLRRRPVKDPFNLFGGEKNEVKDETNLKVEVVEGLYFYRIRKNKKNSEYCCDICTECKCSAGSPRI